MTERKKKKKTKQSKATDIGLEGFVDWTNPEVNELTEEEEAEMSYLVSSFAARMCKRVANAQGLTAPGAEVSGGKRPKLVGLDEEAQKSLTVIKIDFPDQASDARSALEGAP